MRVTVSTMSDEEAHGIMCKRASLNFKNAASFAKAALRGMVSADIQEERAERCMSCDMLCKDDKGAFCGMCGCETGGTGSIVDLTRYVEGEKAEERLCEHPRRSTGAAGWRR